MAMLLQSGMAISFTDFTLDRSESNEAEIIPVVKSELLATRGRGALENPDGRFEPDARECDPEATEFSNS